MSKLAREQRFKDAQLALLDWCEEEDMTPALAVAVMLSTAASLLGQMELSAPELDNDIKTLTGAFRRTAEHAHAHHIVRH